MKNLKPKLQTSKSKLQTSKSKLQTLESHEKCEKVPGAGMPDIFLRK